MKDGPHIAAEQLERSSQTMFDSDAVIIVPSQGDSHLSLQLSATTVNNEVYSGSATIVKTTVKVSKNTPTVTLKTVVGKPFLLGSVNNLKTVLTISHAGACDGPNLAAGDTTIDLTAHQPWNSLNWSCYELSVEAKSFWKLVSKSLRADGKIILIGCEMGVSYAKMVATETGKRVYGSMTSLAAAHPPTVLKHVKAIEEGGLLAPMRLFTG